MTTSPLAYFWGDDDLSARRAPSTGSRPRSPTEAGAPLERWELRGALDRRGDQRRRDRRAGRDGGHVRRRHAGRRRPTSGALVRSKAGREELIRDARAGRARATRSSSSSATKTGRQGRRRPKKLADAIAAAGGEVRGVRGARRPAASTGWIEHEARERGRGPRAGRGQGARRSASAAFVTRGRRRPPRPGAGWPSRSSRSSPSTATAAPVTVDDVRALVAEASRLDLGVPRRGRRAQAGQALELLDRLLESTPEPVLIDRPPSADPRAARDRATGWRRASACRRPPRRWASTASSGPRSWRAGARLDACRSSTAALDGLLELDAMVKGAPGHRSATRRSVGWRSRCG